MGVVVGNTLQVNVSSAEANPDGTTATVTLQDLLPINDAPNRFEGGALIDSNGTSFMVVSNTQTDLVVNKVDGTVPAPGNATLQDDDELQDGQDVPAPDTSTLAAAMEEAFIVVVQDLNEAYYNDNVTFLLHEEGVQAASPEWWQSRLQNSTSYWVTYLLGAFQGPHAKDNDPSTESNDKLGVIRGDGRAVMYLETIRDVAKELNRDPTTLEQDRVVWALGTSVGNLDGTGPGTLWPSNPSRYTEQYKEAIRKSNKPRNGFE
jgi:hypothetical protein